VTRIRLLGFAALWGCLAGVAILETTNVVSRFGPSGPNWSLQGNGALLIPFGVLPSIFAGAWASLVLQRQGTSSWIIRGFVFGMVGVLVAAAGSLLPFIWLPALEALLGQAPWLSPLVFYGFPYGGPWLWAALSPVVAYLRHRGRAHPSPVLARWYLLAGALFFFAALAGGYIGTTLGL